MNVGHDSEYWTGKLSARNVRVKRGPGFDGGCTVHPRARPAAPLSEIYVVVPTSCISCSFANAMTTACVVAVTSLLRSRPALYAVVLNTEFLIVTYVVALAMEN